MPKMIEGQGEELSLGYRLVYGCSGPVGVPQLECVLESKHKPSGRHRKEHKSRLGAEAPSRAVPHNLKACLGSTA